MQTLKATRNFLNLLNPHGLLESTSPLCWCFAKVICTFPIVLDTKVVNESLQGIQEKKKRERDSNLGSKS